MGKETRRSGKFNWSHLSPLSIFMTALLFPYVVRRNPSRADAESEPQQDEGSLES